MTELDDNNAVDNQESADSYMVESNKLAGAVEALLFVSDEPVNATTLAKLLEVSSTEVEAVLSLLATRFEEEERGIQLRKVAGGWRLYTHPAFHEVIERYVLSWDTRSLSQAALEALAVIAYYQPTTRAAVNSIRGVNSEGVVSSLIEKGLVREMGRDAASGNAILYGTTRAFLEKFGLKSIKELPALEDFAPDEASKAFIRDRLSAREPSYKELEYEDTEAETQDDTAEQRDASEHRDAPAHTGELELAFEPEDPEVID